MKNVEFNDEKVKELYKKLIKDHRSISGIILKLLDNKTPIKIVSIENNTSGIKMIINKDNQNTYIYTDFLKRKIYVDNPNTSSMEIYDDIPIKDNKPIGYLYKNGERTITEKLLFKAIPDKQEIKHYEINENSNHYSLIFRINNTIFDADETILELLHRKNKYNSIRDLLMAIIEYVDISHIDVYIADSKGSNVSINNGTIKTYIEYLEKDNHQYDVITMENGNFYINKRVKEEYQDNLTLYIKKLGEYHGKEKR